jgi:hypothetical protein
MKTSRLTLGMLAGIILLTLFSCGDPYDARALFESAQLLSTQSESTPEMIETKLNELLEKFPKTNVAKKVPEFRKTYPVVLQAAKDAEAKAVKDKKIKEEEEKKAYNKFVRVAKSRNSFFTSDNVKIFYDGFSPTEREHILNDEIKIGDGRYVMMFISGYYQEEKSETKYGTSYSFYKRNDDCKYEFITVGTDGKVDYINQ